MGGESVEKYFSLTDLEAQVFVGVAVPAALLQICTKNCPNHLFLHMCDSNVFHFPKLGSFLGINPNLASTVLMGPEFRTN
jgi:hypothetical protein